MHAVATLLGLRVVLGYVWNMLWFQTTLSARVQEFTVSMWGQPDPQVNAPYRWIVTLATFPAVILAGWILAKVHQAQRGAAVMISCLVATAFAFPRLLSLVQEPISVNLYLHLAMMMVVLTGLLLGALMASSQEEPTANRMTK